MDLLLSLALCAFLSAATVGFLLLPGYVKRIAAALESIADGISLDDDSVPGSVRESLDLIVGELHHLGSFFMDDDTALPDAGAPAEPATPPATVDALASKPPAEEPPAAAPVPAAPIDTVTPGAPVVPAAPPAEAAPTPTVPVVAAPLVAGEAGAAS